MRLSQISALPDSLLEDRELQVLEIVDSTLSTLPEQLAQLTGLQQLVLSNCGFTVLPEVICRLPALKILDLSHNKLRELPSEIGQLRALHHLLLTDNKLGALPDSLGQLTQLHCLDLHRNDLTELPESLAELTQLRELTLSHNQLDRLPTYLGGMQCLNFVDVSGNRLSTVPHNLRSSTQVKSLLLGQQKTRQFRTLRRRGEVAEDLRWTLALGCIERARQDYSLTDFIRALDDGAPAVRAHAAIALELTLAADRRLVPLRAGDQVLCLGKFWLDDTELRQRLAKQGIAVGAGLATTAAVALHAIDPTDNADSTARESATAQPRQATTHLLLGEELGDGLQTALDWRGAMICQAHVQEFLQQREAPYLLQHRDKAAEDNLKELLRSSDSGFMALALQMLRGLGVSPAVRTDLYMSCQLTHDSSNRTAAMALLNTWGNSALRGFLSLNVDPSPEDRERCTELGLDDLVIAHRLGDLNHLIEFGDADTRRMVIREMISGDTLDAANRDLPVVPEEIAEFRGIRIAQLIGNKLKTLPPEFGELELLEELDLSWNYSLRTLPAQLANLQRLRHVGLRLAPLHGFPDVLLDLPALESLNLWGARLSSLPPEITRLTRLGELDIARNTFKVFPEMVFDMQSIHTLGIDFNTLRPHMAQTQRMGGLRKLLLRGARSTPNLAACIDELRQKLPRCKVRWYETAV